VNVKREIVYFCRLCLSTWHYVFSLLQSCWNWRAIWRRRNSSTVVCETIRLHGSLVLPNLKMGSQRKMLSVWFLCLTRKPPVKATETTLAADWLLLSSRLVVTYLRFPSLVCFPWLSVCWPCQASHTHFCHITNTFLNLLVVLIIVVM